MGTRGFFGFVVDGEEKIAYNHSDSYPGGLGRSTLRALLDANGAFSIMREQAAALRVVKEGEIPTPEDIEHLRPWTNLSVGERSELSWYCLLRYTQGKLGEMLSAGYVEDASGFPADSLSAEWGYVVDFDAGTFEVYQGFQRMPHDKGRFAAREPYEQDGYWPVALVASWPLDALPSKKDFIAKADPEGGD